MVGMVAPGVTTDLLAAVVRGDPVDDRVLAEYDPEEFCRHAARHDVLPLVAYQLAGRDGVPAPLRSMLRQRANEAVVADLLRESELKLALAELGKAGVSPLIIKGGQLAFSHYPRPDLRPREDTDILIPASARSTVHDALLRAGYTPSGQMSGELVAYQACYVKRRQDVLSHVLDVHWKIANSQVFAGFLSYDELSSAAVPLPRLAPSARGLSDLHALLLACVHRVAHHYDSDHLVWLYDIHLIARGLTGAGWEGFIALAAERKVVGVCRRSLERAVQAFRTVVPAGVWTDSRFIVLPGSELTAGYLEHRRHAQVIADDLRALPTWADRWQLLREHLFPPAEYMRNVYSPASQVPLLFLYARRLMRGGGKWLGR